MAKILIKKMCFVIKCTYSTSKISYIHSVHKTYFFQLGTLLPIIRTPKHKNAVSINYTTKIKIHIFIFMLQ